MKLIKLAATAGMLSTALTSTALLAQDIDLESAPSRAGYSMGVNIGMNIASQLPADELDMEALVVGVRDAISGNLKLSEQEIMVSLQEFSQMMQEKAIAAQAEAQAESQRFLDENGARSEVTTTASGLQYEVLSRGDANGPMPSASDRVRVHYHGTLVDGTVFDSSVEKGESIAFSLGGVIPGWTEGLQLMHVGDKFRFFIPSDLAYGDNGAPPVIGPGATLIFDVELLGIE
jgi:FKBP-type peptidyl-prolyl cis-trans isomerase